MNTQKITLWALAVCSIFITAFYAQADTFKFTTDSYISFPGYPQKTGWGKVDEYGDPKIDSMTVTLDKTNKYLESVVLNIRPTNGLKSEGAVIIRWDSLFINTNYVDLPNDTSSDPWDQTWDYFVHSGGNTAMRGNPSAISGTVPTDGLYEVLDTYEYTKVVTLGRIGHPDGIDSNYLTKVSGNAGGITGVFASLSLGNGQYGYTITYDFSSLSSGGIKLENGFTIGYTPWCANDVFLASAPVPEPATMLLFGTGLIGLAGFVRSRKNKH